MNKLNYVTRQLSRATKKRFEHYVVTRIWHLLNDSSLKFTTQQYVVRPEGHALTDMYFPQLKIHIEVDERFHLGQKELDAHRDADIVNVTQHKVVHIDTTKSLNALNGDIDNVVEEIRATKNDLLDFQEWNSEKEQNPQTYIDKGSIKIEDDVAFHYSYLAANCFGHSYTGFQKGGTKHPKEVGKMIWFPRLYPNGEWNNSISKDEETITEISKNPEKTRAHIDNELKSKLNNRIVFARVKSPLGDVMYRFRGEYKLEEEASSYEKGLIWKRIATKVNTYSK
jgi:very-short-patch-repair endonuclease